MPSPATLYRTHCPRSHGRERPTGQPRTIYLRDPCHSDKPSQQSTPTRLSTMCPSWPGILTTPNYCASTQFSMIQAARGKVYLPKIYKCLLFQHCQQCVQGMRTHPKPVDTFRPLLSILPFGSHWKQHTDRSSVLSRFHSSPPHHQYRLQSMLDDLSGLDITTLPACIRALSKSDYPLNPTLLLKPAIKMYPLLWPKLPMPMSYLNSSVMRAYSRLLLTTG